MRGRIRLAAAFTLATVGALAVTAGAGARADAQAPTAKTSADAATAISCSRPRIGIQAPITGDAASIGQEQRNWARYARDNYNASRESRTKRIRFSLVEFDTQLDPARASTTGQRAASNSTIAAIVGPAGSQEILAVAPIYRRAGLAYVSGSATRTSLTIGPERIRNFFRVVPHDGIQGPTIARYIRATLNARNVMIVDDQTAYSIPLSNSIQANLRAGGVTVARESVNQDQSDFSSIVSKISNQTVVVLVWQLAAKAQIFGQQMREQGKTATIFDGLFSPSDFTINGSYVASFAPDIRTLARSRKFATGYTRKYGNQWGTFGPPTYLATQAAINAIVNACRDRRATRAEVQTWIRRTVIRNSLLGFDLSFTANGDPRGARFSIFRIVDGAYRTVG
jgi:branched-chain amino acid transport system substrate-binding protein